MEKAEFVKVRDDLIINISAISCLLEESSGRLRIYVADGSGGDYLTTLTQNEAHRLIEYLRTQRVPELVVL
jgi:hypothetical protein